MLNTFLLSKKLFFPPQFKSNRKHLSPFYSRLVNHSKWWKSLGDAIISNRESYDRVNRQVSGARDQSGQDLVFLTHSHQPKEHFPRGGEDAGTIKPNVAEKARCTD